MSIARKCDRCGRLFDLPKDGELSGFQWVAGPNWDRMKLIDLCADCTDKLSDWLEGFPEIVKEEPKTEILGDKFLSETAESSDKLAEDSQSAPKEEVEEVAEIVTSRPDKAPIDVEAIVKARLAGKLPKQIAKEYGVKPNTVSNYISNFKSDHADRYKELKEAAGQEGNL